MEKTAKMKRIPWFLAGFFCLLWTAGCSTLTVETDYDLMSDFSRYKTYGWMPAPEGENIQAASIRKKVGPLIEAAIERELKYRGFDKKKEGQPDFFVAYHGNIEHRIETQYVTYGCGPRSCPGGVEQINYTEGTLVLDVIDAGTNELVWRGTSMGPVAQPHNRKERVIERVRGLLKQFPPR